MTRILTRWGIGERRTGLLCAVVLGLFISYLLLYLFVTVNRTQPYPFGDFFALWSYAKVAVTHPVADIYDPAKLHAAQVALGMNPADENPFPYPPTFLLFLWPLGFLPYRVAYGLWVGTTLPLYLYATMQSRGRAPLLVTALVAPTTALAIISGQSGLLAGALLIGGLRLIDRRPIVGGLLLGLLTYKPQLGILVPVGLASAKRWRGIAAACVSTAILIVMTSAAFGWTIWRAWISALPAYSRLFDAEGHAYNLMPTITANLQMLGATPTTAQLVQAVAAFGTAIVIWRVFRNGVTPLAIAALLAGTFLTTPHAFVYDLPILTGAVITTIGDRLQSDSSFDFGEIVILVLALAFPAIMIWAGPHIPISTVPELLLFGLIVTRRRLPAR